MPTSRLPITSRVFAVIVDHRRRIDYLWAALFAALPLAMAWYAGAAHGKDGFLGYLDRLNWVLLIVVLPSALFGLRWIVQQLGPIAPGHLPEPAPPIIRLISSKEGQRDGYAAFRAAMLAPRNLLIPLALTIGVHVLDTAQTLGVYLSGAKSLCTDADAVLPCGEAIVEDGPGGINRIRVESDGQTYEIGMDWGSSYMRPTDPPQRELIWATALVACLVQFTTILIGFLLISVHFAHNRFFLGRIYQRRRVPPGDEEAYIHIDIEDPENCFGFRTANRAFNVQVLVLALAGIAILTTRFFNISPELGLFPDPGQWLSVLSWFLALLIVSIPILVKILPRLSGNSDTEAPASLTGFLREFLSDANWHYTSRTSPEEIDTVARRFAQNAFWPTGNNRGRPLYFAAFWVFLVALVPDIRVISDPSLPFWAMIAGWAICGVVAWILTSLLFRGLRALLAFVDERLVEQSTQGLVAARPIRRKISVGLFLSYRRDDSAAYTGRLYDSLCDRLEPEKIFMDLDNIPGGANFAEVLRDAIDSAEVMVVVIGPTWLTLTDADGNPRIHDPEDFVYLEIAQALDRDMQVIPVLVGDASMPPATFLPEPLKDLAVRNAVEISNERWTHDVDRLIAAIDSA